MNDKELLKELEVLYEMAKKDHKTQEALILLEKIAMVSKEMEILRLRPRQ